MECGNSNSNHPHHPPIRFPFEFSGDDADRMPDAEFETQVLPRVVQATRGWVDPIPVFTSPMASQTPL